jgi:hypothetical protein
MSSKPWASLKGLKEDCIIRVADILRRARDSAARHAKPHLGDKLCSIGLVAYERSCHALALAAIHEYADWLSVMFEDNHFVVKIHGVPSRFYRGEEDLPIPARTLRIGFREQLSLDAAFQGCGLSPDIQCFRFEVTKNAKGFATGVNLVTVGHNGQRIDSWPIPKFVAKSKGKRSRKGAVELKPMSLDDPMPDVKINDASA